MNLVVGATGLLGSEICRLLAAENKPVRALVRQTSDQSRVAQLESLNAEIVQGDLKQRSSLDAACRGASVVISTASATISRQAGDSIQTVDLEGQLNLIDAARKADVSRFVLVSIPESETEESPLESAKRAAEEHLKASGLAYTILQPTFFMEVWLSPALGFDAANARAQVYGSGENPISWISYKDVARYAVASASHPPAAATADSGGGGNAVIKLGGPEALSPLEVVKIFEKITGRRFDIQHVPEEALRAQKEGAADPLEQSFAALMLNFSQGSVVDMRETLRKFPALRPLTSVGDYARTATAAADGA